MQDPRQRVAKFTQNNTIPIASVAFTFPPSASILVRVTKITEQYLIFQEKLYYSTRVMINVIFSANFAGFDRGLRIHVIVV